MVYSIKGISSNKEKEHYTFFNIENRVSDSLRLLLSKGIEFKPYFNFIIGPNGSGKSTLLNFLKVPTFTYFSWFSMIKKTDCCYGEDYYFANYILKNLKVEADYSLPYFNLNSRTVHDDSFKKGELNDIASVIQEMDSKTLSSGQLKKRDMSQLITHLFEENHFKDTPFLIASRDQSKFDYHKELSKNISEFSEAIHKFNKTSGETGLSENRQITIFLDEPEANLDLDNLIDLYNSFLSHKREDTQIICALNNVALIKKLFNNVEANWIELKEGYLNKVCQF